MKQQLPNTPIALYLLLFAMLFMACNQNNPKTANEETTTQQSKSEFSLGDNTNNLPVEAQLQRYNAGLESMERYLNENAGKMTPQIEQELKDKIESARKKIDSLTNIINSKK
ncbi:hypothetical protein B6N25_13765 [Sphingobacteriales bacterium TSM_CSS]|nr:hypothetical protein B6N25_13765 [Sphingobacteriales bacterium TSM_CSS]